MRSDIELAGKKKGGRGGMVERGIRVEGGDFPHPAEPPGGGGDWGTVIL